MNLRIEGQQLRFRISKDELKNLYSDDSIIQSTIFPNGGSLDISLLPQNMDDIMNITYERDSVELRVQKQAIQDLYNALPSREGIQATQVTHAGQILELILEVDIRTQKRNRSNHES